MSVNLTNNLQPAFNFFPQDINCINISTVGTYVLTAISFTNTLLILPPSAFVLYLGFQRWRRQRSAAITTHSDFFSYNMAVIELIAAFSYALYYCSSYANLPVMQLLAILSKSFIWAGQILFLTLTCVERYLAVVHPITYRGLRQAGGVRIRNITTGCIWLMCFVWMCFMIPLKMYIYYNLAPAIFMLILCLTVMLFCSVSVLRVLTRPRPGKVSRDRVLVDQSKQRAIRTILMITGVLWLKFGGSVVGVIIRFSALVSVKCAGEASILVFSLAGSLVLPLLFLHRAGKLPNCKHKTGGGLCQI